ncbi:MAG: DUF6881 domain-containing protein [Acidovorax sp.]|uniref:DUF6881 domain-containing protein n=1 Tax=Acidovorax sp. TaxID=1872122 RepID=UPI0039187B1E
MTYIDVRWHHFSAEDPTRLVSELDANRWELRKLEFFPDGRVGCAGPADETHGTKLGETPVPSLEEINAQAEFDGVEVDAAVFESLWSEYASVAR